jgi:hypothetical protein
MVTTMTMMVTPVVFPKPPIDVSKGKIVGGMTGMPGPSDSGETDNGEDDDGSDDHKLTQIAQAMQAGQPITVALKGHFQGFHDKDTEVIFCRPYSGQPVADIMSLFQGMSCGIESLSACLGSQGLPISCLWAKPNLTRDQIAVTVSKVGKGITITIADPLGAYTQFPTKYVTKLVNDWEIVFGAQKCPSDFELTQYLINITTPWEEHAQTFRPTWNLYATMRNWRGGGEGEIAIQTSNTPHPDGVSKQPNAKIPWNSVEKPTFIEGTSDKEVGTWFKFARDSGWPLSVTLASVINDEISLSVTYQISWDGCSNDPSWVTAKFMEAAQTDGLVQLSVWARDGSSLMNVGRKENNSIRLLLVEKTVEGLAYTLEDPGIAPYIFYGPMATIRIRCGNCAIADGISKTLYAGQIRSAHPFVTSEWALIAAFNEGYIPEDHVVTRDLSIQTTADEWNPQILEAGLKTQNYDK